MSSQLRNNFIQAYLTLNKTLIKTLNIKSSYATYAINKEIILEHGESAVNLNDKTSWKYYKNLAGEYHFTDITMKVISLDTREEIIFSVENLAIHNATCDSYQYGTRYYNSLLNQYPKQEALIHGILNPANKDYAIAAENGSILSYAPSLVEEYETTLIMELESFIKLFQGRWDVEAFNLTDPYYGVVQKSLLALQLLPKLLNLRLKRCKTSEVHSFHLREYLASNQGLDKWLPYLTREQALWLYRNIKYLERNSGSVKNFNILVENLLDKRQIPISKYSIRQLSTFDDKGYPLLQARRKQIGTAPPSVTDPLINLNTLFNKEIETTYGNAKFLELNENKIIHKLATSSSSVIKIKNLESILVDLSDCAPDTLDDVMLRQWVSMTHQGLYNVAVNFQDPKTTEPFSLLSHDAIIYMLYITCKMEKIPFDKLPRTANIKFCLNPKPKLSDLTNLIEKNMDNLQPVALDLYTKQPLITKCSSIKMFHDLTFKIYEESLRHWFVLASIEDLYERSVVERMIYKFFGSELKDFSNGESGEDWRIRNNIPVYNRTYKEAQELIQQIFEKATGFKVDGTKQLRNIQNALISLFESLSSYTIQFMREINDSKILLLGGSSLRLGHIREEISDETLSPNGINITNIYTFVSDEIYLHNQLDESIFSIEGNLTDKISIDISLTTVSVTSNEETLSSYHLADNMTVSNQMVDPVSGDLIYLNDGNLSDILTQEQLLSLKFIGV